MHNFSVQRVKFALPIRYVGKEITHENLAIWEFYFPFPMAPIWVEFSFIGSPILVNISEIFVIIWSFDF